MTYTKTTLRFSGLCRHPLPTFRNSKSKSNSNMESDPYQVAVATHMVTTCKSLSAFGCTVPSLISTKVRPLFAAIINSLGQHAASLTKLSLDAHRIDPRTEYQRMKGISHFGKLKSLNMSFDMLLGTEMALQLSDDNSVCGLHNMLPPDLEKLELTIATNATPGSNYTGATCDPTTPHMNAESPLKQVTSPTLVHSNILKSGLCPLVSGALRRCASIIISTLTRRLRQTLGSSVGGKAYVAFLIKSIPFLLRHDKHGRDDT